MSTRTASTVNEVNLVGRVSGEPVERELPSGDLLVQFRLVVPRRRVRRSTAKPDDDGPRALVDTIDIACWTSRSRTSALRLVDGQGAQVTGELRRRFFATGAGRASRYEVEASSVKRVTLTS